MSTIALSIETSQRRGEVALDTGATIDRELLDPERRSDEDLLPAIDRLCRRHGTAPRSIDVVVVSLGPGGFTGLRVAISVAKMLGELGARVVGVPSALVAVHAALAGTTATPPPDRVMVLLATKRRGETVSCWASVCEHDAGGLWTEREAALHAVEDLPIESTRPDLVLADEHVPVEVSSRCTAAGIPTAPPRPDAVACLRAAGPSELAGPGIDPVRLAPIYPREPEAVALWDARRDTSRR